MNFLSSHFKMYELVCTTSLCKLWSSFSYPWSCSPNTTPANYWEAATVRNFCANVLCQMLPEDDAALGLEMDSWKCLPFKPAQNQPWESRIYNKHGNGVQELRSQPVHPPGRFCLSHKQSNRAYKGAWGQTELLWQECWRKGGTSPSQTHITSSEQVSHRDLPGCWLAMGAGPASGTLVSLVLPSSPWGLWLQLALSVNKP